MYLFTFHQTPHLLLFLPTSPNMLLFTKPHIYPPSPRFQVGIMLSDATSLPVYLNIKVAIPSSPLWNPLFSPPSSVFFEVYCAGPKSLKKDIKKRLLKGKWLKKVFLLKKKMHKKESLQKKSSKKEIHSKELLKNSSKPVTYSKNYLTLLPWKWYPKGCPQQSSGSS